MAKYGSHSFAITDTAGTPVMTAFHVDSMAIPANVSLTEDQSGDIFDSLIGLQSIMPNMTCTTRSVAEALSLLGFQGGCLGADPLPLAKFEQFFRPKTSCGGTGGTNLGFAATRGLYYLNTLTANRGQEATLSFTLETLSTDGSAAPVAMTESATLPTSLNTDTFVPGDPQIAGLSFPEATAVTINFNSTTTDKQPGWGSIYPTEVGIEKVRPDLRIDGVDLARLKAAGVPIDSKEATHANTLIPFRKKKNRSAFVADATQEHFSLTMSGLFYFDTIASASGNGTATNSLMLKAAREGSTAPIVASFDEAYAG